VHGPFKVFTGKRKHQGIERSAGSNVNAFPEDLGSIHRVGHRLCVLKMMGRKWLKGVRGILKALPKYGRTDMFHRGDESARGSGPNIYS